jgi:altronate dehydratase
VVTVTCEIKKGEQVVYALNGEEKQVEALTDIPRFHKIAITPVKCGEEVIKYGAFIGYATKDIQAGEHVHTHNIYSKPE